ncbi:MAG TPA: GntR family transcriptional regulator [Acidimicrobiia bacterium]|nr:GntR family transcriptional regulator [Acidimicrobiia bacterium]
MSDGTDIRQLAPLAQATFSGARQTAHEFVRNVLRRVILSGELAGGTRLVQADLAAMLEVSTTPVREALRDLASEGLIRFDPHRGAVVHELSGDELREIYMIREVLEPFALRLAVPKVTPALLAKLETLHARMASEPHSAEWVDANRQFHLTIYEAAGFRRLSAIIRGLEDASVMYIGASLKEVENLRETAIHDHAEILSALEKGDTDAAVAAVVNHLRLAIQAFEARSVNSEET